MPCRSVHITCIDREHLPSGTRLVLELLSNYYNIAIIRQMVSVSIHLAKKMQNGLFKKKIRFILHIKLYYTHTHILF